MPVLLKEHEHGRLGKSEQRCPVAGDRAVRRPLGIAGQGEFFPPLAPSGVKEFSKDFKRYSQRDRAEKWRRGLRFKTKSGVRVRSKIEKIIADFLFEEEIRFIYEAEMMIDGVKVRPDFYYCRAANEKISRYNRSGVRFMYTTSEDEAEIEDTIVDKLAAATLSL